MKAKIYWLGFLLVLVAMLLPSLLETPKQLALILAIPARPILFVSSHINNFFRDLGQIQEIRSQVIALEEENNWLKSQVTVQQEVINQSQLTQQELNLLQIYSIDQKAISANIIGHSPVKILDQIIIDKGANDQIDKDQAVIAQGFLIGIVDEVSANFSSVTLITNAKMMIPIITANTRAQGLLRGGLLGITAGDLPGDIKLQNNEEIITSGLVGRIPTGIPVGKLERILSAPSEILQTALVKSSINLNRLERVIVLQTP